MARKKHFRSHLDDFKPDLNGEYSYTGKLWRFTGGTAYGKCFIRCMILALASLLCAVVGGTLPAAGMNGKFYVVATYAAALTAALCASWGTVKMRGDGTLRAYIYETSVLAVPKRALICVILCAAAILGELIELFFFGAGERLIETAVYLLLMALSAVFAFLLRKTVLNTQWE